MPKDKSMYAQRGVSSTKEEVHAAITGLDKGIYPNSFCKILPDIAGNLDYCFAQSVDTAGTKPSASYLAWKETGDISYFMKIVQDAIVMNIDDLACAGFTNNFYLSSVIARNKFLISGDVIKALIQGQIDFIQSMQGQGINIIHTGGETADVSDIVRTLDVGASATARALRSDIISIEPHAGMVIVGLASFGQASYETEYNSGIGSNGLTNGRHSLLCGSKYAQYAESYSPEMAAKFAYVGDYTLSDKPEILGGQTVANALLSPTRTYLPILRDVLQSVPRAAIGGIVHCTGGGQTKVNHFIGDLPIEIIKDNLFNAPGIFNLIQEAGDIPWQEMYNTLNMGHRMEVYVSPDFANEIINISKKFNVDAKIVGRVEEGPISEPNKIRIETSKGVFIY